jgi:hypothetical protein
MGLVVGHRHAISATVACEVGRQGNSTGAARRWPVLRTGIKA